MNLGTLSHSFCFSFVPQNFLRFKYPPSLPLLRSDVVGGVLNIYLTHRFSVVLMSNQSLKSSGLVEWKKKIPLIAAAVRVVEVHVVFHLCLTFPVPPLGTRTPVSNICGHGERWAPETYAWDVV